MIKQAIIPLAGLGTRLLPLTSVFAKELLPINGKPGIEYILEECIDAGVKEIIFIISKKKMMIKKYFYSDKFYKNIIKKKKDPNQKPGKGGEIHITDAIQSLINENERFIAHNFTGKYLDCGTMNGFIKSNIEISKL